MFYFFKPISTLVDKCGAYPSVAIIETPTSLARKCQARVDWFAMANSLVDVNCLVKMFYTPTGLIVLG